MNSERHSLGKAIPFTGPAFVVGRLRKLWSYTESRRSQHSFLATEVGPGEDITLPTLPCPVLRMQFSRGSQLLWIPDASEFKKAKEQFAKLKRKLGDVFVH